MACSQEERVKLLRTYRMALVYYAVVLTLILVVVTVDLLSDWKPT